MKLAHLLLFALTLSLAACGNEPAENPPGYPNAGETPGDGEVSDSGEQPDDGVRPEGLVATPADYSIALTWRLSGAAQDFQVLRRQDGEAAFSLLAPTTGGALAYTDERILLGKTYEYAVQAVLAGSTSAPSAPVAAQALAQPKDWTLVYFISSDGDYPYDYWFNIDAMQSQGGSSDRVNVLALYDGYAVGDSRYYLVGGSPLETASFSIPTAPGGEVNMGSAQAYTDFIDWLLPRFTARHYLLSFHDHGTGALGAEVKEVQRKDMLIDQTSGDSLDPDEQAAVVAYLATRTGQPVDLVESMVCLGQMVENTYGMSGHARYHIGAESLSYVTTTFPIRYLAAHPDANAAEIAQYIAEDHYRGVVDRNAPCHWSLLDLDRLSELSPLMATLAIELRAFAASDGDASRLVRQVAGRAQNFALSPGDATSAYVDIKDLALQIAAEPALPQTARDQALAIVALFEDGLVVANYFNNGTHPGSDITADYSHTYGLSVYHPNAHRPFYADNVTPPYASLSFSAATGWADYLQTIALPAPTGLCPLVTDLTAALQPDGRVRISWSYSPDDFPLYDAFFVSRDLGTAFTGTYYTIPGVSGQSAFEAYDRPTQSGTYTYRVTAFRQGDQLGSCNWSRSNAVTVP